MSKEIDDLTEYTSKPESSDMFLFKRVTAGVTRCISFLNMVRDRWVVKTAAYTLQANDRILANTTSTAVTLTLPLSPSVGDTIRIADSHGQWNSNNLTVDRNLEKIRGASSNITHSTQWEKVTYVYVDSTVGWIYF